MTNKRFLNIVFVVVIANFAAQIPYLVHQYHGKPSVVGVILMVAVLAWFLAGYILLLKNSMTGFVSLISFLIVEFLFYLSTQITQAASGKGILLHVLHPDDPFLFIVFGIGYINFIAAGYFVIYLLRHKSIFVDKDST